MLRVFTAATALASLVRTATQNITSTSLLQGNTNDGNPLPTFVDCSGIEFFLNITATGTGTLALALDYQDPASGNYVQIASTTAANATGLVRLKVAPGITAVAATTTAVVVNDTMPPKWRIRVVHSDGSNYTYSLGYVIYN